MATATTMQAPIYRKGDRVQTSGAGRTAHWPHQTGTVTHLFPRRKGRQVSVEVRWDGTHFGDQMATDEVALAAE